MKYYIEIVEFETGNVERCFEVTNYSERRREKIEAGANINLNHDKYFTRLKESAVK